MNKVTDPAILSYADRWSMDFSLLGRTVLTDDEVMEVVNAVSSALSPQGLHAAWKLGQDPLQLAIDSQQAQVKARIMQIVSAEDTRQRA